MSYKVSLTVSEAEQAIEKALHEKERKIMAEKLNRRFQKLMRDARKAKVYGYNFFNNPEPFS